MSTNQNAKSSSCRLQKQGCAVLPQQQPSQCASCTYYSLSPDDADRVSQTLMQLRPDNKWTCAGFKQLGRPQSLGCSMQPERHTCSKQQQHHSVLCAGWLQKLPKGSTLKLRAAPAGDHTHSSPGVHLRSPQHSRTQHCLPDLPGALQAHSDLAQPPDVTSNAGITPMHSRVHAHGLLSRAREGASQRPKPRGPQSWPQQQGRCPPLLLNGAPQWHWHLSLPTPLPATRPGAGSLMCIAVSAAPARHCRSGRQSTCNCKSLQDAAEAAHWTDCSAQHKGVLRLA